MSAIIQNAEKQIQQAKKAIHDERVKEARKRLNDAIKNGNDKELADACRSVAGLLNPPSANRKPKPVTSPIPQ